MAKKFDLCFSIQNLDFADRFLIIKAQGFLRPQTARGGRKDRIMDISDLIVKQILSVYTVNLAGEVYKRVSRPCSGICLKLEGSSVYTHNGTRYLSDSTHLLYIPQGATYSYRIEETGTCIIVDFIAENNPPSPMSLCVSDRNILKSIADSMQYAWNLKSAGFREFCLSGVYQLLYHAALGENHTYASRKSQSRIEKSIQYLSAHFCDHDLSVGLLAEQSGISEIYFRKQFSLVYGMTPKKYLTLMRINYARELLDIRELTIQQIAEHTGFGDVYSFCKTFHREVSLTPSEYRKMHSVKKTHDT